MASNRRAVENAGTYPDWIELYNSETVEVDLGGWFLFNIEDNGGQVIQNVFRFPAGYRLAPDERRILWCDSNTNSPGTHTRFPLDRTGCYLVLRRPSLQNVDAVSFGLQLPDRSIGRVPDGPSGTWTLSVPTPAQPNLSQPLGPVTGLKVNEWTATNRLGQCAENEVEGYWPDYNSYCADWIEIYNGSPLPVLLTGLVIADGETFQGRPTPKYHACTNLSFIEGNGFQKFICDDKRKPPDHLNFGLSSTFGDLVRIYNTDRSTIIDEIQFPGNQMIPGFWPGTGSYGRFPDGGPIYPERFLAGTPGEPNFQLMTNLVVNEVLTHTDPPLEDAIEVFNLSEEVLDISGWWMSDDKEMPQKFRVPNGTVLTPRGYHVFYEMAGATTMPRPGFNTGNGTLPEDFRLSSLGDDIWIFSASNDFGGTLSGLRGSLNFGAVENGVSLGLWQNSVGETYVRPLASRTFGVDTPASVEEFRQGRGAPNALPRLSPLVITEVYYYPPTFRQGTNILDNDFEEFIEIYNASTNPVRLFDPTNYGYADGRTNTWRLGGSVALDFPTNLTINPGEFLLAVNFSFSNFGWSNEFRRRLNVPPATRLVSYWRPYDEEDDEDGKERVSLPNDGGVIELLRPDAPKPPGHNDEGVVPYVSWERLDYNPNISWFWPTAGWTNSSGGSSVFPHIGYSLHKITPEEIGNEPGLWWPSPPTPGRQPIRAEITRSGNQVGLKFLAWAGASYTIEFAASLDAPVWEPLSLVPREPTSRRVFVPLPGPERNRFFRVGTP